ncbi:hypothetical protein Q5752_000081 [Cryptotrichosporon argae]
MWTTLDALDGDAAWLDTPSEAAVFEAAVRAEVADKLRHPMARLEPPLVTTSDEVQDDLDIVDKPLSTELPAPDLSFSASIAATPAKRRLLTHLTPSVPTPSRRRPLPAPPATASTFRRTKSADTPTHVATPTQTPARPDVSDEARGRRDDPATPAPLGAPLGREKTFQTLTSHFDVFKRTVDKGAAKAKGKGKGKAVKKPVGLGGTVLSGLRFCMPPAQQPVNKQKQRWGHIVKLGGVVVLQPDTAITHVIYGGRSAITLARELGLESLSELPKGTVCVKWEWVTQCQLTGVLQAVDNFLSFPRTTFTRAISAQAFPSRFADITDQLRGASFRKREHTASDSETGSPICPGKRGGPSGFQRPAPPDGPRSDEGKAAPGAANGQLPLVAQTDRLDGGQTATRHEADSGPGWLAAGEGEADALDVMISGVKDGSIEAEESDDDANPKPKANHFKCGQTHDSKTSGGPNEWLAKKFEDMHSMYEGVQGKSDFAIRGYQKAAGIMRRTAYPITSGAQARGIKGIGTGMADRIDEFLSGAPGRAHYEDTEQVRTIAMFKDIYGVGKVLANQLYRRGAVTMDDLRDPSFGLTAGQMLGIDLYDDLKSRIPRAECRLIYEQIQAAAHAVDPKLLVEIMGSYRRGQDTSGDVDILITRDDADGIAHHGVLKQIIGTLTAQGIITHSLSQPTDWDALEAKWMGVGRLGDGKHRRIDILTIPFSSWGAALLYFTGNEVFNRSLRLYARKRGYTLNQRGLYGAVHRDAKGNKLTEGTLVASRTEQEIFDVLGIRWRAPEHRRP